ncbi:MAG TPA: NUDIX domain-containing protein [Polyangiaceae bacterium]|nr:NUDIX domain-containing protein [Polyangiaceae bacterium]
MRVPRGLWGIVKEAARHLLRRPVAGIVAVARVPDGRWVLVRRADTGEWALPGGTLEWGETLRTAIVRELREEAGVEVRRLGEVVSVYSDPDRDLRFHAVTVVVTAEVTAPVRPPENPAEIREVGLFSPGELPIPLAHGMTDIVRHAGERPAFWE